MAIISPFKGFRYSETAGRIENLIAPPYDVIGSDYRKVLIERSQHNIVHLTLPESFEVDYHKNIADKLKKWCDEKILVQDLEKKYYVLRQTFHYKGRTVKRTGFICLIDLSQSNRIIKHEVIFNKYRDDRIKLLDITKANLEPIFLLYEDKESILEKISENLLFPTIADFEDYTIEFSDCNPEVFSEFMRKLENTTFFIADGHHRFQASYEYYRQNPQTAPGYIMCYLTNLFSDSLVVLPTHRAIMKNISPLERINEVKQFFDIEKHQNLQDVLHRIEEKNTCIFGVFFNGNFQTWKIKNIENIKSFLPEGYSDDWKTLDSVILHYFVLQKIFGIPGDEKLYYDIHPETIVKKVEDGECSIGFFMREPDIMKIKNVSLKSEILPPKTTFFYPKIPSGLVIARYI